MRNLGWICRIEIFAWICLISAFLAMNQYFDEIDMKIQFVKLIEIGMKIDRNWYENQYENWYENWYEIWSR